MSETPRTEAPARRAARATTGTTTARRPRSSAARPAAPAQRRTTAAAPGTPPAPRPGPLGLSIHVPFLTITLGPQASPGVPAVAKDAGRGGGTVERLAFYGGVATMGALGVLDWPVAAAIAAGTWVAQHTLPGLARPAAPAGHGRDGGDAGTAGQGGNGEKTEG